MKSKMVWSSSSHISFKSEILELETERFAIQSGSP